MVASSSPVHLKIVHFNDLHGHVAGFTPQGEQPIFSRIAGHLAMLRAAAERDGGGVLALSAGDDCVGSPFDLLLGEGDPAAFHAHPAYRLYSAAGLDACAIGNHDLDWGEAHLARSLHADARFPALSANLTGCRALDGLCFPAAIFVVQGVTVAVIGLTTSAQMAHLPGSPLTIADPITTLHRLLPDLMPVSDVRIVLSHLGHCLASHPAAIAAIGDVELAHSLPAGAVHLIVGGHTHQALNEHGLAPVNVVNGIPIVQTGCAGDYVGEVDLIVQGSRVEVTNARLISTSNLPVDDEFEARHVQPLKQQARLRMAESLGRVDAAMDEATLGSFIADGLAERCRLAGFPVDCAVVDGSCMAVGLQPGPLTLGDWHALMPYADTIQLVRLSGWQLRQLLCENAQGSLHFSQELRRGARAWSADSLPTAQGMERIFTLACTSFMVRVTQPLLARADSQESGLFVRRELSAYVRSRGGVAHGVEAVGAV